MNIYYFNITPLRNKIMFQKAYEKISNDRKEKVISYKQTDDKLRCVGAGLLIEYIRELYNIKSNIVMDKYGKIYFEDNTVNFNISHSGNFVVLAVSENPIGIDIQRIRADKHRVAEKNFLPAECDFINEGNNEAELMERFCQVWTVKEAYLKKIGIGLRKPLKSFEVDMSGDMPVVVDDIEGKVIQFKMDGLYIVSVSTSKKDDDIKISEYTFK